MSKLMYVMPPASRRKAIPVGRLGGGENRNLNNGRKESEENATTPWVKP